MFMCTGPASWARVTSAVTQGSMLRRAWYLGLMLRSQGLEILNFIFECACFVSETPWDFGACARHLEPWLTHGANS